MVNVEDCRIAVFPYAWLAKFLASAPKSTTIEEAPCVSMLWCTVHILTTSHVLFGVVPRKQTNLNPAIQTSPNTNCDRNAKKELAKVRSSRYGMCPVRSCPC